MKIHVEPSRVSFEIRADETVMAGALRNGYSWPTICAGEGSCGTCVALILEGQEHLSPMQAREEVRLRAVASGLPGALPNALPNSLQSSAQCWRLACQTKVSGDIRLRKIGVRKLHAFGEP